MSLAAQFDAPWTVADALRMVGQPIAVTVRKLIDAGVRLPFEELESELLSRMQRSISQNGIEFRPGARELVSELAARGIAQALVTMSYGPYMDALSPWLPPFQHIQLGNSVERGKPAPDIYLAAMGHLGMAPGESLGIEDSVAGAGAILAAGITPVTVPGHGAVHDDPRLIRIESLAGVTPDRLITLHQGWQER